MAFNRRNNYENISNSDDGENGNIYKFVKV